MVHVARRYGLRMLHVPRAVLMHPTKNDRFFAKGFCFHEVKADAAPIARRAGPPVSYILLPTLRAAHVPKPLPRAYRLVCRMIHVCDLVKAYSDLRRGEFLAVAGVSFHARPGEILGLLGPNGAGKTSVLRILSTILRPTSGSATINGFDVLTQPAYVRQQIGFVSVNTAVYDRMTAWELVEYFGRLYGLPTDALRDRMEKLFEQLQMQEIRDVLGAKMSTGMKQKVSIARALVHDPPVLIFDEATSGLDVLVARALLQTISRLRDQG
jgi:sodium transport system ATP-binding protein